MNKVSLYALDILFYFLYGLKYHLYSIGFLKVEILDKHIQKSPKLDQIKYWVCTITFTKKQKKIIG